MKKSNSIFVTWNPQIKDVKQRALLKKQLIFLGHKAKYHKLATLACQSHIDYIKERLSENS